MLALLPFFCWLCFSLFLIHARFVMCMHARPTDTRTHKSLKANRWYDEIPNGIQIISGTKDIQQKKKKKRKTARSNEQMSVWANILWKNENSVHKTHFSSAKFSLVRFIKSNANSKRRTPRPMKNPNKETNEQTTKKKRERWESSERENKPDWEISLSQIISLSIDRGSQKRVIARRPTNPFRCGCERLSQCVLYAVCIAEHDVYFCEMRAIYHSLTWRIYSAIFAARSVHTSTLHYIELEIVDVSWHFFLLHFFSWTKSFGYGDADARSM